MQYIASLYLIRPGCLEYSLGESPTPGEIGLANRPVLNQRRSSRAIECDLYRETKSASF
jgi:hypothetical protein